MTLTERFNCFKTITEHLQSTNSIVEKRMIISCVPQEMQEDVSYIIEVLGGHHKYGFTYDMQYAVTNEDLPSHMQSWTIKKYLEQLNYCNEHGCWSNEVIRYATRLCRWFGDIVEPIVNRTLRLGIGKSILPQDGASAMLGKKYEGEIFTSGTFFITEKLDGNRCIAIYDGIKWNFVSRNGKPLKVNFNMQGLPTHYVYDGEIMSKEQTTCSEQLYSYVTTGKAFKIYDDLSAFNNTSGLINSKYGDKSNLIYNIFDVIVENVTYVERRDLLNNIQLTCSNKGDWRIVPVLAKYDAPTFNEHVHDLLDTVTNFGAEGLMINRGLGIYQHTRTNDLLKYKKVQTMDLIVESFVEGRGKYEGMVGALNCVGMFDDGTYCECQVGSGMTDEERELWALKPDLIVGKLVEVAYFSKSNNKNRPNVYSLRFPRLKQVRNDKLEVSKY